MPPWQNKCFMKSSFYSIIFVLLFTSLFAFKSKVVFYYKQTFKTSDTTTSIHPEKFLATLTFDGKDGLDNGETCFPQSFSFNTTQDANKDGEINVEDNLENLVLFSIGNNISGMGRTGLTECGPNDQRPAIYFHYATAGIYQVYEYWLYYADNDWLNNHEHDWEKYFVYVKNDVPKFIKLSHHNSFTTYTWERFSNENGFPIIGVHRGSHAMHNVAQDGVKISHEGKITANNGKLLEGNNQSIPWIIYSNDKNVSGAILFSQSIETFYYGDPSYFGNGKEWGDPNLSPWKRLEWSNPPLL